MANDIVYHFVGAGVGPGLGDLGSSGAARPIGFYGGEIRINPPDPANPAVPTTAVDIPINTGIGTPTPPPVQYQFTFDTIGQTIARTIGHCRLGLKIIWAEGINESGDITTSNTISFGAALCAPFDPDEEGSIVGILIGSTALFDDAGVVIPNGMSDTTAALLTASINNAFIYPGDEAQEPCPLIVSDKGSDVTNAFRGIRYIVFPAWPLAAGMPANLSLQWTRTNDISNPHTNPTYTTAAVEFASGGS